MRTSRFVTPTTWCTGSASSTTPASVSRGIRTSSGQWASHWECGSAWVRRRGRWRCEDGCISVWFADDLVHGLGLVYNAGERVEGYSNFLWTMGIALGMRLGVGPEAWTVAWGVVFFAATIALLCAHGVLAGKGRGRVALGLPLAGLLAAVHRDWYVYATSGLETSCFTFLVTL